jgi:hypothetical protein
MQKIPDMQIFSVIAMAFVASSWALYRVGIRLFSSFNMG